MKIILVEDDSFIAEEIKCYFELKKHEVICYSNGEELLQESSIYHADIFLLDINMPVKNGIETLKELRSLNVQTPVIFLTSMSDVKTIKSGFNAGCSDYVRKPFHFEELEIRMNKLIFECMSKKIKIGPKLFYDITNMELIENNKVIQLSEKENNLFYLLIQHLGHTVQNETLMDYVWEDKVISTNTLRTLIKKLRSKLSYDCIQNFRGNGYKIEKYD